MNAGPDEKLRSANPLRTWAGRFSVAPENDHVYIADISTAVRHPSRAPRMLALVALLLVAAVVGWLLLRSKPDHYRLVFSSAGQLVKGDLVRIGGTPAGKVTSVGLSDDDQAEIDIDVNDSYGPLHEGTTATIRAEGLTGVASRYVDISPASETRPKLDDGALIRGDKTTSIVEIDQLFDTLDPKTREGLKGLIRGSADWYDGRESQANVSAQQIPKALAELSQVADEITSDSATFEQFLVKTGDALGTVADHRDQLTGLVSNTQQTADALASDTASLSTALHEVPAALDSGSDAFAQLRPALTDLRRLTDATEANTKDLKTFLEDLTPVLHEATPTIGELRRMFAQPGAANDLLDALKELPTIARETDRAFPSGEKALRQSTPIFSFARPYIPDIVAWTRGYAAAGATYDANGHYIRTVPVFNAFTFRDDANGGTLTPRPATDRGTNPAISTGNLKRCPGAATSTPADRSTPFIDQGPLANSDCDPAETVRANG
jgi:phospholipid/cholesterol/gamma-HCH transport system substrate-binding protein